MFVSECMPLMKVRCPSRGTTRAVIGKWRRRQTRRRHSKAWSVQGALVVKPALHPVQCAEARRRSFYYLLHGVY